MFYWRDSGRPQGPIFDWLLENEQQIREGTVEYIKLLEQQYADKPKN